MTRPRGNRQQPGLLSSDGYLWSDGLVWSDGHLWSDGLNQAMSVNTWVEQE